MAPMPPWAISSRISKRSTRSPLENVESAPTLQLRAPRLTRSGRGGGGLGQLGPVARQVALGRALRVEAQRARVLGDVAAHVDGGGHVAELLLFQRAEVAFADLRALRDVAQLQAADL